MLAAVDEEEATGAPTMVPDPPPAPAPAAASAQSRAGPSAAAPYANGTSQAGPSSSLMEDLMASPDHSLPAIPQAGPAASDEDAAAAAAGGEHPSALGDLAGMLQDT